jgi:hypothetical protein
MDNYIPPHQREKELSDRLQRLNEGLAMAATNYTPYNDISDMSWHKSVIEFSPEFKEPIQRWNSEPGGRALLYLQAWDVFCSELWNKVENLVDSIDSGEYFNAWMRRRATTTWEFANGDTELPSKLLIQVDEEATVTEVFEMLVGRDRHEHIWWDQLVWACDYLKVELPV